MSKTYIIIAYDGTEIIDSTPEAEIRIAAVDYLTERIEREQRKKAERQQKLARNPLWKLVCACGIV